MKRHIPLPMRYFHLQNAMKDEQINELLSLVPRDTVRLQNRLKGYSGNKWQNMFSSYLTAGEYYPVEPSILTLEWWDQLGHWINQSLGYVPADIIATRCQLNVINENMFYHPLTIAPHADTLSPSVNVAAINIPLLTTVPFKTAFWKHKRYGNYCGGNVYDKLTPAGTSRSEHDSMSTDSGPFSAVAINRLLEDNQCYRDSESIVLKDWSLVGIAETSIGDGVLYDGRLFHSPYLKTRCTDHGKSSSRVSLAIFLAYRAGTKHAEFAQETEDEKNLLYEKIVNSIKTLSGTQLTSSSLP